MSVTAPRTLTHTTASSYGNTSSSRGTGIRIVISDDERYRKTFLKWESRPESSGNAWYGTGDKGSTIHRKALD